MLRLMPGFALFGLLVTQLLLQVCPSRGQAPAPGPALSLDLANSTVYFLRATCYGTGTFSGQGTTDNTEASVPGVFTTPGATFQGNALITSDGGEFNGTGVCNGDAQFNITADNPSIIGGDGTVTGDGTFGLAVGTFVGSGTYAGSNISFANGTGSFDGIDATVDGTALVSGNNFICNGTGTYQGSGTVEGYGVMEGTMVFDGDGIFEGTGVFKGDGVCEGDESSFISNDRSTAIAQGFPSATTLAHPSASPGAPAATS